MCTEIHNVYHLWVYRSVALSTFTTLSNRHRYLLPELSTIPNGNSVPIEQHPPWPLPQPLWPCGARVRMSSLFKAGSYSMVCIDRILHIRSSVDGLFPPFGYCEWCCSEHGCANIRLSPYFYLLGLHLEAGLLESHSDSVQLFEKPRCHLPQQLAFHTRTSSRRGSSCARPRRHWFFSVVSMMAVLVDGKRCFIVVSACIFFTIIELFCFIDLLLNSNNRVF